MLWSKLKSKITNCFAILTNQMNQKANTLLSQSKTFELDVQLINEKRRSFLDEIHNVELINLVNLSSTRVLNLIESNNTDDEETMNKIIFKSICFIVDSQNLGFANLDRVDATFGYLVVIDKYLSSKSLNCYRDLLNGLTDIKELKLNYNN